jgi:hypothetical protein
MSRVLVIANSWSFYLVQLDLETRCAIARNSYHRTGMASELVFEGPSAPAIHPHSDRGRGSALPLPKHGAADDQRVVSPR